MFCLPLLTAQVPTGAEAVPQINLAEYEQVLNSLFPLPPQLTKGLVFTLGMRIVPAFGTESQINIVVRATGLASTVSYSYVDRNVFSACNEFIRTSREEPPGALATRIHVNRREVEVAPRQLFAWQRGLFKSLSAALQALPAPASKLYERGTSTITLDGDSFELWYAQGLTHLDVRFDSGRESIALAKWALGLRDYVARAAVPSK